MGSTTRNGSGGSRTSRWRPVPASLTREPRAWRPHREVSSCSRDESPARTDHRPARVHSASRTSRESTREAKRLLLGRWVRGPIADEGVGAAMASREHEDERRRANRGRLDPERRLPPGDALFTPGAGRLRQEVERRSAVPLVWLHQRPHWLLPLLLGVLFIAGLTSPGVVGALCLLTVAAFFAWLAFLTWPTLARRQRVPRVLMVLVVLVLALARASGL